MDLYPKNTGIVGFDYTMTIPYYCIYIYYALSSREKKTRQQHPPFTEDGLGSQWYTAITRQFQGSGAGLAHWDRMGTGWDHWLFVLSKLWETDFESQGESCCQERKAMYSFKEHRKDTEGFRRSVVQVSYVHLCRPTLIEPVEILTSQTAA